MNSIYQEIMDYIPKSLEEQKDQEMMLELIKLHQEKILTRDVSFAHFTSSSMIFNQDKTKILMVFHRIYKSWSWTGGHADGNPQLLEVAIKEAKEETGIKEVVPLSKKFASLEVLPVWGHMKKDTYVSSHLHLNVSYLFMANEQEELQICEDENTGVLWIPIDKIEQYVTERNMFPIYYKLIQRAKENEKKSYE